jgi:hypothetical protein
MMLHGSEQGSLEYQRDHEKAQELLSRFVEIERTSGNAASMYPDIAAHLAVCSICYSLYEDLQSPSGDPAGQPFSQSAAIEGLEGSAHAHGPIPQTPLDLLSRAEIILRVRHILAGLGDENAAGFEIPAAGYLLFYDTLRVGKADLVVMFTLHSGSTPGLYRIEGVITPEQPDVRYKALLRHASWQEAVVDGNHLLFDEVPLGTESDHMVVTLGVHTRWKPGR